jgi:hypothetical protein
MDKNTELWAVTYLHNWDPTGKIYPEVHAIYNTFQEAEAVRKAMSDPSKYWVTRARIG